MPARFRYQSGPLIWSAILGVTSVLLFLFQHVLWLVIPGLLALIGYYLLYPLQQRLIMGGVSSDVYRFQPLVLTVDGTKVIHGTDEHISLDNVERMVRFYQRLVETAGSR